MKHTYDRKKFYIWHYQKQVYKKNYKHRKLNCYSKFSAQLYKLLFYFYFLKDFIFYKYFLIKNNLFFLLINIYLSLFNSHMIKFVNKTHNRIFKSKIRNNLKIYYLCIIKLFLIYNYNLFLIFFYQKNKYRNILQKIIELQKISKTRKKGRIRRFKIFLLIGAKNYWVGVGIAKDFYLQKAINKARFAAFKKIYFFFIILEKILFYSNILKNIKIIVRSRGVGQGLKTASLVEVFLDLIGYRDLIIKIYKTITKYYCIKLFIKILMELNK